MIAVAVLVWEPTRSPVVASIATARRMKADGHTDRDIAKYLGVSRATLYRYLAEDTASTAYVNFHSQHC